MLQTYDTQQLYWPDLVWSMLFAHCGECLFNFHSWCVVSLVKYEAGFTKHTTWFKLTRVSTLIQQMDMRSQTLHAYSIYRKWLLPSHFVLCACSSQRIPYVNQNILHKYFAFEHLSFYIGDCVFSMFSVCVLLAFINFLYICIQSSKMVLPLRLSDCSGNSQAWTWECWPVRFAWDWEPTYTSWGNEICHISTPTRKIKTHRLCFWLTWVWVIFCCTAWCICPTEGMGCCSKSQHEISAKDTP